ncbi:hypothetical protein GGI43DRAFT_190939 [Trichoderma evansii]
MRFFNAVAAVVLGLAAVANGHMEMSYPPPFRSKLNANYKDPNIDYSMTSPLADSGNNYPCKGYQTDLGTESGKSVATWAPGGSYNFTIDGGANHAGGSCQASLSYDKGQTFKVIHSYIGECPPAGVSSWDFTVPADAPAGEALFAWTWFNNVGNREMYMNCAAVTIGAGKKRAASVPFASRPDIFVANVGPKGNGVLTVEGKDVEFPQPGNEVDRKGQNTAPPAGSSSGSSVASQPAATSAPAPALAPTSASQAPGGVFVTAPPAKPTAPAGATSSSKPSVATSVSASSAAPVSQPQPQPTTGSGNSSPSSPSSASSPSTSPVPANSSTATGSKCSTEGQWNCLSDGKSFQRCAAGFWSVSMPVAAGTSCKPGLGDSLVMVKKRSSSGFAPRRRFIYEQNRGKRVSS